MTLYIIFLCIQVLFALLVFFLTIAFVTGAPYVPSTSPVAQKMIHLSKIKSHSVVYDLGSGDGRLLFLAAKAGAKKVIGYEINPFLVLLTTIRVWLSPYRKNIKVVWKNFWQAKIADADVVFVYLLPWRMDALAKKLKTELKPGTRIVSNSFIFPNWNIRGTDKQLHIYVFEV